MPKETFAEFLKKHRAWYKTIRCVYCPILNENIIFNAKGFYHLRYDNHGKIRNVKEQRYKIGLLPLVIPAIQNANKIHEYKKGIYSKPMGKFFEIWELKEIVGRQDTIISVVLRRIGTGNITFLSVWKKKDKKQQNSPI